MQKASWLDRMALRQIESMRLGLTDPHASTASSVSFSFTEDDETAAEEASWELYLEFPYFPNIVVYDEAVYDQQTDMFEVPIVPTMSQLDQVGCRCC